MVLHYETSKNDKYTALGELLRFYEANGMLKNSKYPYNDLFDKLDEKSADELKILLRINKQQKNAERR